MQAAWHDKLTLLLESTGDGMFGVDLDGRCTFINRAGAEILGYSTAQVLGRNMHDLIHHSHPDGSHYEEQQCPIFLAFRTGRPCRNDQEVFWRADGSRFNAEYSSHPVIDHGQVCGAVITFTDITQRKQTEEALARARQELEQRVAERTAELSQALLQLRQLSAHTEAVREQERKRIAREIHDELGSLLVALKFDVNWIARRVSDREPVADKCRTMNRLIETAVEDVGRIITDLRPSILDHQGLVAALEWQLQEFADATEIACDADIVAAPDAPAPEAQQATAVFRIFQEMLSNVARHADASAVRIRIHLLAHELRMEVADNGVGAPAARLSDQSAYGVMGMRERALHFGGALDIDRGDDGAGTRVRLTMPMPRRAAA
ncbi:PAS domain S-box protein [Duganella sp. P38]|uniref:sensor histidine kinase n=1 Tax=Duganella sp. P38 TaxID=3423949 RepID=UPI003D79DE65